MPISIPTFLSYLLLISSARAQVEVGTTNATQAGVSAPDCTDSTLAWTFNSLQQNPCLVTAYLAATCNNGVFSVPTLSSRRTYTGPTDANKGDICICNTVVYNLISACDACQGSTWIPYSSWSFNCTIKASPGTFPNPVPAGTRVPRWAYIDTSVGDNWNISAAQLAGDSPEVTGTASLVPTSTSTAAQSTSSASVSGSSSTSTSTPTSHTSSNASAIAGGVVGGVVGVAVIAGVVAWFFVRRRRARSVPSAPYMDFQGGEKEQPPPNPPAKGALKLYDPSDPTTYPSKEYLSDQYLGSTSQPQPNDSTSHPQPNDSGYSGLPEI